MVFGDIRFTDKKNATCKVGFIVEYKINTGLIQNSLTFTVIDDDEQERRFVTGEVTSYIMKKSKAPNAPLPHKRWQDPEYLS